MKKAILRYETQGALFHHNFSTQRLSEDLTEKLFKEGLSLEQKVERLKESDIVIPPGGLKVIKNPSVPNAYSAPLKLFLDLSNFCNLSCGHCLSSSSSKKSDTLDFETIEDIADQCGEIGVFYVKLGGGEPLLYPEILTLIDMLNAHSLDVSLTTNGTRVDYEMALALMERNVKVSVSVDGIKTTHDSIRGRGSYVKAEKAIQALKAMDADVSIRTTLFPTNMQDIPSVVKLAETYNVVLKIRRAKPSGRATDNGMIMTTPTPEYYQLISYLNSLNGRVDIEDIMNTNPNYEKDLVMSTSDCAAGTRSMHIDQEGYVSPCVFLGPSFVAGNILQGERIIDLWRRNQQFQMVRTLASDEDCYSCEREKNCHNECPAIKLYATGSISGKDPSCLKPYLENRRARRKGRVLPLVSEVS